MGAYPQLAAELTGDPLIRGYAGMTDAEAADRLNVVDRTTNKTTMTGSEVLNAMVWSEVEVLSADDQTKLWNVFHLGTLDPFGIEAQIIQGISGLPLSITALAVARKNNVSRGVELELGIIREGHVQMTRA